MHRSYSDIEVAWRASGSALCIIVEGDTAWDDPWFYDQWFGAEARRFTFFEQDGWKKVEDAVAHLRQVLGAKKVYGIRDRDFEELPPYPPGPPNGVFKTRKYTLENYLLDPSCWYAYIHRHTRRHSQSGWETKADIENIIREAYRQCLPVAAFNWVVREARRLNPTGFGALPEIARIYCKHPKALKPNPVAHFDEIQKELGLTENLGQQYQARLEWLHAQPFEVWEEQVTGKVVLKLFAESFPLKWAGPQVWDNVLGAYLYECATPPDDLRQLLELIWQDAQMLSA